jgi:hypothetical protein
LSSGKILAWKAIQNPLENSGFRLVSVWFFRGFLVNVVFCGGFGGFAFFAVANRSFGFTAPMVGGVSRSVWGIRWDCVLAPTAKP